MTGTPNQIELADQIKSSACAEFARVARAFESVAQRQIGQDRLDTLAILHILEEKREETMAQDEAGYFIRGWRELHDQVRQMIGQDTRYHAIQANRKTRREKLPQSV